MSFTRNTFGAESNDFGSSGEFGGGVIAPDPVPTVPMNLAVVVISDTQIDGSFDASTDDVGVTHYRLRRATDSGFTLNVVDTDLGTSTTFSATGLSPSTEYFFKVLAEDVDLNQSAYSVADSATTSAAVVVVEYDAELEAYANNDPVGTLTDRSGNGFDATNATANKPTYKTDSGDYLLFTAGGGAINYLDIPDYTSLIGTEAQIYLVLQAMSATTRFGRFLGESNQAAAYLQTAAENIYEPFATTTRKDNKVSVPLLTAGFCVYRVVSRNGFYEMSMNGTVFFTTATNTFSKATTNPFVLGYLSSGSDMKLKYLAILNDNTTNLTASLMTRFGI